MGEDEVSDQNVSLYPRYVQCMSAMVFKKAFAHVR